VGRRRTAVTRQCHAVHAGGCRQRRAVQCSQHLGIAIKARFSRADFAFRPHEILRAALETGFVELPVRARAAMLVADLPLHHRDPFDRLLIAQAISEPVRLYTADPVLPPYSELVTLVA
jgi:PIN domain nuclease of toxin-antitoxin system